VRVRRRDNRREYGRALAQKLYPVLDQCEWCAHRPATERHHLDGDTHNNVRENLLFLCRWCHHQQHPLEPEQRVQFSQIGQMAAAAKRRAATYCKHGHEFTPENTYINARGQRVCRACGRRYAAESKRRRAG